MEPSPWADVGFVLCDLDGVVWLARRPIQGSVRAIERLRASGRRVVFVTNNSMSVVADQEAALAAIGIPANGDVVTSAQAGASLLAPGETVLVCGAAGLDEAVAARGATVVRDGPADAVIVGLDHDFDYWRLRAASAAIRGGARFIATNDDPSFPTPTGQTPGAGALVAAVATASGVDPVIAGKPYGPMAGLVAERCGPDFRAERAVVVGDRPSTDGRFAQSVGCAFALVRTGVTPAGADPEAEIAVALDVADLAAVVEHILQQR
ncbi:MAG TPA: HAD-IIA family hydrolase [Acidimicrobiia bacterium]|nr:HAD-IIA family hydrolase [Acidimicrobiia bacterium]